MYGDWRHVFLEGIIKSRLINDVWTLLRISLPLYISDSSFHEKKGKNVDICKIIYSYLCIGNSPLSQNMSFEPNLYSCKTAY